MRRFSALSRCRPLAILLIGAAIIYLFQLGRAGFDDAEAYSAYIASRPNLHAVLDASRQLDPGKGGDMSSPALVQHVLTPHWYSAAAGTGEYALPAFSAVFAIVSVILVYAWRSNYSALRRPCGPPQIFTQAGTTLRPATEAISIEVIKAMVKSGVGCALLPDMAVHAHRKAGRLATAVVREILPRGVPASAAARSRVVLSVRCWNSAEPRLAAPLRNGHFEGATSQAMVVCLSF